MGPPLPGHPMSGGNFSDLRSRLPLGVQMSTLSRSLEQMLPKKILFEGETMRTGDRLLTVHATAKPYLLTGTCISSYLMKPATPPLPTII